MLGVCPKKTVKSPQSLFYLTTNLFQRLSDKVLLETKYQSMLTPDLQEKVHASHLGIGSRYTWHGSPDARVHGEQGDVNVVFSHFQVENLFDEDND